MIRILSAGRSGSGWLCSVLKAAGLRVMHEGFGDSNPDVYSETSDLWRIEETIEQIQLENQTVILLDRDREEVEASVAKYLGPDHDWTALAKHWRLLQQRLKARLFYLAPVPYDLLFGIEGMVAVQNALHYAGSNTDDEKAKWYVAAEMLPDLWTFYRSFRITNQAAEAGTKATWT